MKRTYPISVIVEGVTSRKVNSRGVAKILARHLAGQLEPDSPWKVVGTKVTSKAVSEAKPKVVLPNPKQVARDALVASLQVHADAMARLLGNVVRPRLRRHPSRVCWGGMRGAWAHAHTTNATMYRFQKGKRTVRLGNLYGTVCLSDGFLDTVIDAPARVAEVNRLTGHAVLPADGLDTIAHEIAHLRVPKRAHRSEKFHETADRLEREYREVLNGTRSLPPLRSFGRSQSTDDSVVGNEATGVVEGLAEPAPSPTSRFVDTSLSTPATDNVVREAMRSASSLDVSSSDDGNGRANRPAGIAGAGWRGTEKIGPGEAQADDPIPLGGHA